MFDFNVLPQAASTFVQIPHKKAPEWQAIRGQQTSKVKVLN